MVNTDIAPALPWGAASSQTHGTDSTVTAAETGSSATPCGERAHSAGDVKVPSAGSKIEVQLVSCTEKRVFDPGTHSCVSM